MSTELVVICITVGYLIGTAIMLIVLEAPSDIGDLIQWIREHWREY